MAGAADAELRLRAGHVMAAAVPHYRRAFDRGVWSLKDSFFPLEQIQAISRLKSDADQLQIWTVFAQRDSLRFCGDVLKMLMGMNPYPMPSVGLPGPPPLAPIWTEEDPAPFASKSVSVNVHTGAHSNFCVNLPDYLRRAELNTDWSNVPEFNGRIPDPAFTRMLDQICLGSESLAVGGGAFPPPFAYGIEKIPLAALAHLYCHFPLPLAVRIMQDWGLILRSALSSWLPPSLTACMQQNDGTKVHVPRECLRVAYERASLEFLIQRYGVDKLV